MDLTNRVRRKVIKHLKTRGWSYGELARRAGLHRSFVRKLATDKSLGMSLSTVESLSSALEVSVADLIGDEEASRAGAGPGPPEAERELLAAFRALTDSKKWKVVQDLQRRALGREQAPAQAGMVALNDIAPVARGAEPPADCVEALESSAQEVLTSSSDRGFRKLLRMKIFAAAEHAGGDWVRAVEQGRAEIRPAYCFEDLRAMVPFEASTAMLYIKNMPRAFKDDATIQPPVKVVIEPRSLLACVDEGHTLAPQTMVVAVPHDQPDVDQATMAYRIAATLSLILPERLGPGVDWGKKSYRPRVSEIRELRMPASITGQSQRWKEVDRLVELARRSYPLADQDPTARGGEKGLDHCAEQRTFARRLYPELTAAIEHAFGQVS